MKPGERRFKELLRREREDVSMLAQHVAEMYDAITFGRVSKPTTKPFEVIALYEERLNAEIEEAISEERKRIREEVSSLPMWSTDDFARKRGAPIHAISESDVLAIIERKPS